MKMFFCLMNAFLLLFGSMTLANDTRESTSNLTDMANAFRLEVKNRLANIYVTKYSFNTKIPDVHGLTLHQEQAAVRYFEKALRLLQRERDELADHQRTQNSRTEFIYQGMPSAFLAYYLDVAVLNVIPVMTGCKCVSAEVFVPLHRGMYSLADRFDPCNCNTPVDDVLELTREQNADFFAMLDLAAAYLNLSKFSDEAKDFWENDEKALEYAEMKNQSWLGGWKDAALAPFNKFYRQKRRHTKND